MKMVTLVSGGLDSTVMSLLAKEEGITQFPLFIDYGQLGRNPELRACRANLKRHGLPKLKIASLGGYGALLSSGLTDPKKDIYNEAFLPCRNLMFVTVGAAYAHQCGASAVGIGLLDDAYSIFPDQTKSFLRDAAALLSKCLGVPMTLRAPLMSFSKKEVLRVAKDRGIDRTYSCHSGNATPCGVCIACREYLGLEI